ncbi:MAG: AraC family transcriptional regulator ligand-binding domain-containing protein [Pseudomonadota bacterium]
MSAYFAKSVVPADYACGIISAAVARGLNQDELLRLARIMPGQLEGRRARIAVAQFSRLYSVIANKLDDEAVGLHSRPARVGGIELLCRAALTATTLADCLPILALGLNVVLGDFRVTYQPPQGDLPARLYFGERVPIRGDRVLAHELALLTVYGVMSWVFARSVPLVAVALPYSRHQQALALRLLMPAPMHFDADEAALMFPPEALSLRIARTAEDVSRWMRRAPASLIEALVARADLSSQIVLLLQESMPQLLTLNAVAERLAMSPRTLHRKLVQQGTSFQRIKDDWRLRLAMQRLSCTDIPVKQIAVDLGFSDQAAFRRAFTHWAGRPPGAYRQPALAR